MASDTVDGVDTIDLDADAAERRLTQMVAVLAAEFPDVPHDVIEALTRQAAGHYDAATVRTFLPILVPKDVRALLSDGAERSQVPTQPTPGAVLQVAAGAST